MLKCGHCVSANSVYPDRTAPKEQSDQGLHVLSAVLFVGQMNVLKVETGRFHSLKYSGVQIGRLIQ